MNHDLFKPVQKKFPPLHVWLGVGNRMKNEKRMKMDGEKKRKETWNAKWNFESEKGKQRQAYEI